MPAKKSASKAPSRPDRARIAAILAETSVLRPKVLAEQTTLAEVQRSLLSEQKNLIKDLGGAGVERALFKFHCTIVWVLGIPVVVCTLDIEAGSA